MNQYCGWVCWCYIYILELLPECLCGHTHISFRPVCVMASMCVFYICAHCVSNEFAGGFRCTFPLRLAFKT